MTQTTDVYCYLGMHVNDDAIRLDETRKNNDNYLTLIPPVWVLFHWSYSYRTLVVQIGRIETFGFGNQNDFWRWQSRMSLRKCPLRYVPAFWSLNEMSLGVLSFEKCPWYEMSFDKCPWTLVSKIKGSQVFCLLINVLYVKESCERFIIVVNRCCIGHRWRFTLRVISYRYSIATVM